MQRKTDQLRVPEVVWVLRWLNGELDPNQRPAIMLAAGLGRSDGDTVAGALIAGSASRWRLDINGASVEDDLAGATPVAAGSAFLFGTGNLEGHECSLFSRAEARRGASWVTYSVIHRLPQYLLKPRRELDVSLHSLLKY